MTDKPFAYDRYKTVCTECDEIVTANAKKGDGGSPGIYIRCDCDHINYTEDTIE